MIVEKTNDPRLDLMAGLVEEVTSGIKPTSGDVREISTDLYISTEHAENEKQVLFRNTPIIVGHGSQLAKSGDHFTHDHLGVPILVVRGADGVVRAFLNACRHRGVRLANNEQVERKPNFVCPYHHWVYGLDGTLKSVPLEQEAMPGLDKSCRGLRALPAQEKHGLIWVNPTEGGELNLDEFLGNFAQDLDLFNVVGKSYFAESVKLKKTNWKLIVEAFLDGYHVQRLHNKTVGMLFMDCVAATQRGGRHIRSAVARNEFSEALKIPREKWDLRYHTTFSYFIYPNTTLIFHPDYMSVLSVFPSGPEETIVTHTCVVDKAPVTEKEKAHWERAFSIIENGVFEAEDFFVCEQAQIGMSMGIEDTFLVGAYEQGLQMFHDILQAELLKGSNRAAD